MEKIVNKYGGSMSGIVVNVRDNNVDKALRIFKKKIKDSNLMMQIKDRGQFEKPSAVKRKKKLKAIARNKYIKAHTKE